MGYACRLSEFSLCCPRLVFWGPGGRCFVARRCDDSRGGSRLSCVLPLFTDGTLRSTSSFLAYEGRGQCKSLGTPGSLDCSSLSLSFLLTMNSILITSWENEVYATNITTNKRKRTLVLGTPRKPPFILAWLTARTSPRLVLTRPSFEFTMGIQTDPRIFP